MPYMYTNMPQKPQSKEYIEKHAPFDEESLENEYYPYVYNNNNNNTVMYAYVEYAVYYVHI